jgi:hypothetical protein
MLCYCPGEPLLVSLEQRSTGPLPFLPHFRQQVVAGEPILWNLPGKISRSLSKPFLDSKRVAVEEWSWCRSLGSSFPILGQQLLGLQLRLTSYFLASSSSSSHRICPRDFSGGSALDVASSKKQRLDLHHWLVGYSGCEQIATLASLTSIASLSVVTMDSTWTKGSMLLPNCFPAVSSLSSFFFAAQIGTEVQKTMCSKIGSFRQALDGKSASKTKGETAKS